MKIFIAFTPTEDQRKRAKDRGIEFTYEKEGADGIAAPYQDWSSRIVRDEKAIIYDVMNDSLEIEKVIDRSRFAKVLVDDTSKKVSVQLVDKVVDEPGEKSEFSYFNSDLRKWLDKKQEEGFTITGDMP